MTRILNLLYISVLFSLGLSIFPFVGKGQTKSTNEGEQIAKIQKRYGLDPKVPLTGRIKQTSPEILKKFRDAGFSPVLHKLNKDDSMKVVRAFNALPPLHQRVLKDHLLGISFLDNMPNTALTAAVNPDDSLAVFTITFRAEILRQNVSEWLTEKERSYFTDHPNLKLSIEAGKLDAILYVLLHEATHVVDGSLGILNDQKKNTKIAKDFEPFTEDIWLDRITLAPKYKDTLSSKISFRPGGRKPSIETAKGIYQFASDKPFVSLYSLSSRHEDLAEYLSVSHFTDKLRQPFRIVLYENGNILYRFEPMKSLSVKSRISLMDHFYESK